MNMYIFTLKLENIYFLCGFYDFRSRIFLLKMPYKKKQLLIIYPVSNVTTREVSFFFEKVKNTNATLRPRVINICLSAE